MGNDQEMGRRHIAFAPQTADVWFLQSCNCDEKVIERSSLPYIWHQKGVCNGIASWSAS